MELDAGSEIPASIRHLWDWPDRSTVECMASWSKGDYSNVWSGEHWTNERVGMLVAAMELDEVDNFAAAETDPAFHQMIEAAKQDMEYQLLRERIQVGISCNSINQSPRGGIERAYRPYVRDMRASNNLVFCNKRVLVPESMRGEVAELCHWAHGRVQKCLQFARA